MRAEDQNMICILSPFLIEGTWSFWSTWIWANQRELKNDVLPGCKAQTAPSMPPGRT